MNRRSRRKLYDIIIYTSLLLALTCLSFATFGYFNTLEEESTMTNEIKGAIKELNNEYDEEPLETTEEEPEELKSINKKEICLEKLNNIKNEVDTNDEITYDMINTWNNFEIVDITYSKTIVTNYFAYLVYIKIPNLEAQLPADVTIQSYTNEYQIIKLTFNLSYSANDNKYFVKSIII